MTKKIKSVDHGARERGPSRDDLEGALSELFGSSRGESLDLPWYTHECDGRVVGVLVGVRRILLRGEDAHGRKVQRDGLALVISLRAPCLVMHASEPYEARAGEEIGITCGVKLAPLARAVLVTGPQCIDLARDGERRLESGRRLATFDVRSLALRSSPLPVGEKDRYLERWRDLMATLGGTAGRDAALALALGEPARLAAPSLPPSPAAAEVLEELPF